MSPAASTRWCPTTEQLMILEEMYKGGIRTPNASQIQQITTHLSLFGKIEGKSVFYWFQNHKARDRQKLRRKLTRRQQQQQQQKQTHSHYDSSHSHFLPQGGIEEASNQEMNYTWKVEISERDEMEKTMTRTYSRDWMMLMDEGPTPPCCCNRPLRTLELFPITTTSLKDECT